MRFLVDAQLPPALARQIVALGHEAEHVADCGLVTADVRKALGVEGPSVIWVRLGNTRKAELLRRMAASFANAVEALERGETLIEIT